jgi:KUP system potassium uptake protein
MVDPAGPVGLGRGGAGRLAIDPALVTYFLGAELIQVTEREGMARWREYLFAVLSRNSTPAALYFDLPLPQTITLGTAVEL